MKLLKMYLTVVAAVLVSSANPGNINAGFKYVNPGKAGSQFKPFGRYELRAKTAYAPGTESCMGIYNHVYGDPVESPTWMEIDIEIPGQGAANELETVAHIFNNYGTIPERPFCIYFVHHSEGLYLKYHTYSLEFTPTSLTWLLDNKPYRKAESNGSGGVNDYHYTTTGELVETSTAANFDWIAELAKWPMRVGFDIWWGPGFDGWLGTWDDANCGATFFMSWFAYYEYTPGEGPDGSDFTLEDYDDFTGSGTDFDMVRWEPYNTCMREGKACCTMGCNGQTMETVPVPADDADTVDWERTSSRAKAGLLKNRNLMLEYNNGQIHYRISNPCHITLGLYDVKGRLVRTLAETNQEAGIHSFALDRNALASGAYYVSLKTPSAKSVRQIISLNGR
jgi:beta-glucanase (GH16 family)